MKLILTTTYSNIDKDWLDRYIEHLKKSEYPNLRAAGFELEYKRTSSFKHYMEDGVELNTSYEIERDLGLVS